MYVPALTDNAVKRGGCVDIALPNEIACAEVLPACVVGVQDAIPMGLLAWADRTGSMGSRG